VRAACGLARQGADDLAPRSSWSGLRTEKFARPHMPHAGLGVLDGAADGGFASGAIPRRWRRAAAMRTAGSRPLQARALDHGVVEADEQRAHRLKRPRPRRWSRASWTPRRVDVRARPAFGQGASTRGSQTRCDREVPRVSGTWRSPLSAPRCEQHGRRYRCARCRVQATGSGPAILPRRRWLTGRRMCMAHHGPWVFECDFKPAASCVRADYRKVTERPGDLKSR